MIKREQRPTETFTGWVVVEAEGMLLLHTLRSTRREAIAAYGVSPSFPWAWWKQRFGCRVERVTIAPTEASRQMLDGVLDGVIEALDSIARKTDHYEYGLPIYDDGRMAQMREAIREILNGGNHG